MIAVVPGYISRSVAGSYDNEGEVVATRAGKPLMAVLCWELLVEVLQHVTRNRARPVMC